MASTAHGTSTLDELAKELRDIFKETSVNVELVTKVMSLYQNNPKDWTIYAKFDSNSYTRNLVDEGNDGYNLLILAWNPNQGTCIHNHSNSHCFMKVLSGSITEVQYDWPESTQQEMVPKRTLVHGENKVTYINDSMGLHEVKNDSATEQAVSLHLYSPPYKTCLTFEKATGKTQSSAVHFWSIHGKEIPSAERTVNAD